MRLKMKHLPAYLLWTERRKVMKNFKKKFEGLGSGNPQQVAGTQK
jgi:hypothetical protein